MRISRREFAGAALGTLAALAGGIQGAEPGRTIIDPHFHIWDLKRFRLPWLDGAGAVLNRTFTLDDYRAAIAGTGISASVYVEVSVRPDQRKAEAEFAVGVCDGKPAAGVVVGAAPGNDEFGPGIGELAGNRLVRGVRASIAKGKSSDRKVIDDVRLLGKLGLSFDLLWDGQNLSEAAELARAAPDTRFILDHCGNVSTSWFSAGVGDGRADRWKRGIEALAKCPNVACKISGVAESGPVELATPERMASIVTFCLDAFGADRVMFASNWPVCLKSITIAKWLERVRKVTAGRGDGFAARLFHDNARKWYGIAARGDVKS